MASSANSGISDSLRRRGGEIGKGIPRKCRCGEKSMIHTSETLKNPGRLFYCCPYGSKEDKGHLFKWTDIAMVEEMEEIENMVKNIEKDIGCMEKGLHEIQAEIYSLACETRTCEAVTNRFTNDIKAIKATAERCEKEVEELRSFKNMTVCVFIVFCFYFFIFAK